MVFARKSFTSPHNNRGSGRGGSRGRGCSWSYMNIIYDHHIWWSYMMIIYGDHIWCSYIMIIYDEQPRSRLRPRPLPRLLWGYINTCWGKLPWEATCWISKIMVCLKYKFKAVCNKSTKVVICMRNQLWESSCDFNLEKSMSQELSLFNSVRKMIVSWHSPF